MWMNRIMCGCMFYFYFYLYFNFIFVCCLMFLLEFFIFYRVCIFLRLCNFCCDWFEGLLWVFVKFVFELWLMKIIMIMMVVMLGMWEFLDYGVYLWLIKCFISWRVFWNWISCVFDLCWYVNFFNVFWLELMLRLWWVWEFNLFVEW